LEMSSCSDASLENKDVSLSKQLSWLLRHGAQCAGVTIRPDGYVAVSEVLNLQQFKNLTLSDIVRVVQFNEKERFGLTTENEIIFIRAQQGHSIKGLNDSLLLERIISPKDIVSCIHGTYRKAWVQIKAVGLRRMSRNHIHFAPGLPNDKGVISGMRKTCEIYIYVDTESSMRDGIIFYRSKNNVILSYGFDGVLPVRYFKKVVDVENGQELRIGATKYCCVTNEESVSL